MYVCKRSLYVVMERECIGQTVCCPWTDCVVTGQTVCYYWTDCDVAGQTVGNCHWTDCDVTGQTVLSCSNLLLIQDCMMHQSPAADY